MLRDAWTWLGRLLLFSGRVLGSFLRNRGVLLAGGVGYNALLSLVPFLTLTVAALSMFFGFGGGQPEIHLTAVWRSTPTR